MLKNKFILLCMMILLISPVYAEQEVSTDIQPQAVTEQTEVVDNITYKQPVSKRKIAKKFLAAMGGVLISSLALYFILSLYNKLRESFLNQEVLTKDVETSLETPDNLNDAVRIFLEKTKWDK